MGSRANRLKVSKIKLFLLYGKHLKPRGSFPGWFIAYPIKKVALWVGLLAIQSNEGVRQNGSKSGN